MDPNWNETGGGKSKRGADAHYALAKTHEIPDIVRGSRVFIPAPNAHLWMWATMNKLPDALWLGAELGFTYKTNVAWCKTRDPNDPAVVETVAAIIADPKIDDALRADAICELFSLQFGLGQYLRGTHEHLLLFTRGKGQSPEAWNGHRDVRSTIRERRTTHSKKPTASYELIERVSKAPRVELFARSGRPGWLSWGNELDTTGDG